MNAPEKALADALSRMVSMYNDMLEYTDIENICYPLPVLREMSEAPLEAVAVLEAAGYYFSNSEKRRFAT